MLTLTVRVLNTRGVAFITYCNESNAQFAKEAMAHQSLDHEEVLNVRWATADPNPMAQAREARRLEEQAAEAIRRALPADFLADLDGRGDESSKRRRIEGVEAGGGVAEVGYQDRAMLEAPPVVQEPVIQTASGGIFSSSTLAALNAAKMSVGAREKKETKAVSRAPLVSYTGDSDDSE